ncbi:SDR family NAD(P)-dependent oxidoreductase [Maribellus comscasis]|uniref:SDR family NAD(P)-dependent oxidoreductase n=1 Tax=Maribellus comscasis TaxID=2681766 RepID=A0A6I6JMC0_9BACT|nr:oxidoreductase [Maribellus comscasis]QGY44056.1 SDR family NAD(P)-dependent oxidoreductase [Maribellus comscasis]
MENGKWTSKNIPDLTGKVIVVTGGNSGLGFESVKVFAQKGAEVILASRSMENGEKAKSEIGETKGKIVVMQLDLSSFESIKKFADDFKGKYTKIDVLLNNAGIMMTPYFTTKDGLEAQNGINHLGHFALTGQLFDLIRNTQNSRIVNVSSLAHKQGKMNFDNLLFENGKDYSPTKSYGRSKLSNLLFTYELQRRMETAGVDTLAISAHPGVSDTNLARYLEKKFLFKILKVLLNAFFQSAEMGALPQIRACVDVGVKGGEFYGPGGFREMKGYPVKVESNEASHNLADAKKLWELSEKITGVTFLSDF